MLNPVTTLAGVASQHPEQLFKLNKWLADQGFPFYWFGGTSFNTEYRLWPKPRYVLTWRAPFIRLSEIYLSYRPNSDDQKDFVYRCD
jgi:hypothetical protein